MDQIQMKYEMFDHFLLKLNTLFYKTSERLRFNFFINSNFHIHVRKHEIHY